MKDGLFKPLFIIDNDDSKQEEISEYNTLINSLKNK